MHNFKVLAASFERSINSFVFLFIETKIHKVFITVYKVLGLKLKSNFYVTFLQLGLSPPTGY